MPRLIETDTDEQIELGDLVEALEADGFDPEDQDALASYAPLLRRLANNRAFLGDLLIEELKQRCSGQLTNQYSAQVLLLHSGSKKFLLRANFWPAEADSVVINSGTDPFFYGHPHDHNFDFLTVGYFGPGYWSDYYEYDYAKTVGYTGEKVDLRFVDRSRLEEGKTLLYRRHVDVHSQLPADSLSVSLNILALSPTTEFLDQYGFDLTQARISSLVNRSMLEPLVLLAGHLGGENGHDLVEHIAARHPSDRIRFAAWKAKASVAAGPDERAAIYDEAAATVPSGFVRGMAQREASRIRASRSWYERTPVLPVSAPAARSQV
jgi:hypothetical protein